MANVCFFMCWHFGTMRTQNFCRRLPALASFDDVRSDAHGLGLQRPFPAHAELLPPPARTGVVRRCPVRCARTWTSACFSCASRTSAAVCRTATVCAQCSLSVQLVRSFFLLLRKRKLEQVGFGFLVSGVSDLLAYDCWVHAACHPGAPRRAR